MISTPPDIYTDLQGLQRLRTLTRQDSGKALNLVAQQFEALFLQMMLKGVRESSLGDPLLGSQQMEFYREMHDQQLSIELAKGKGMGIAEMLVEQLGRSLSQKASQGDGSHEAPGRLPIRAVTPVVEQPEVRTPSLAPVKFESPRQFVRHLWQDAANVAADLGVSPEVLLAQAALETGWGKKVIRRESGGSSYNLFNIKADHRWKGEQVGVDTLEYVHGAMTRQHARFRAYESYQESFADYAEFLRTNPRYGEALRQTGDDVAFINALQQAGYATDPRYAEKITRILEGRVMRSAVAAIKFSGGETISSYDVAFAGDE